MSDRRGCRDRQTKWDFELLPSTTAVFQTSTSQLVDVKETEPGENMFGDALVLMLLLLKSN